MVHADPAATYNRVRGWKESGSLRIVTPREAWIILFAPHLQH